MNPKRILLMLLLAVASASALISQDDFSIGPRVGLNFSKVTNVDEVQRVTGLVLGLTSTYSFNERTGLTVDALFSEEGYKAPFEDYKIQYIAIPVYFDFFGGELGERFRPKFYAGVVPSFFIDGSANGLDVNKVFWNKFLMSVSGGLGFNYRVGSRIWLNTDLRGIYGLSDIRAEEYAVNDPIKYRTLQASIGLAYGLSRL